MTQSDRGVLAARLVAFGSLAVRLLQLAWLHPIHFDELEYYRASRWIAEGRLPYRDFWEHHTPLSWFVFAPLTKLSSSPGIDAVLLIRWMQIPVWVATFVLANVWMRRAGLSPFARWSSIAFALCSTMFMLPAMEFRIDSLACLLVMAALVMAQRGDGRGAFWCGLLLCMACFANVRVGAVVVITALLLRVVDARARTWRGLASMNWIFAGALTGVLAALGYFAATHSLDAFLRQVFYENSIAVRFAEPVPFAFVHRLLLPLGLRIEEPNPLWSAASVDIGAIAILAAGFAGMFLAVKRWRSPDDLFVVAVVQLANLLSVASMAFIYNYHFELVVILMLPLAAAAIERVPRRGLVFTALVMALLMSGFASVFRGKELDRAYQDRLLRDVDARTTPNDRVFAGIWSLRREPAYRFWFLADVAHQLVRHGQAAPYRLQDVVRDPPGAIVLDQFAIGWLVQVQPELRGYITRHYLPLWRNLWIPGLSARLQPGASTMWIAPRDGVYRVYASPALARDPWFNGPLFSAYYKAPYRAPLQLAAPINDARLHWSTRVSGSVALRKGQQIAVTSTALEPIGIILLPTNDRVLMRQPPPGVTLEGVNTSVTHVPDFHARIE